MLKVALIAAAVAAASMADGGDVDTAARVPRVAPPACHSMQSLEADCALRILDANGDGSISASELAGLAWGTSTPNADWPSLPPQHSSLDFKDAATNPEPAMPATLDHRGPPTILSALLALGALVMLLRKRPT